MYLRKTRARPWLALMFPLFATSIHAAEPPLLVLYDLRPPFVSFDGKRLQGSIGQRAQSALERSGLTFELREIPVPRQLLMIQQNLVPACAVARLKSVERLASGVFSAPLAESPPYVAVVRQDVTLPEPALLAAWVTRPELRWGVQAGLYYSDFVQDQMRRTRGEITRFTANHQHFARLLEARRIDFVIVQQDEAQEMLSAKSPSTLRMQTLPDLQHGEQRFFYCDKRVPEASLRALNQAIERP